MKPFAVFDALQRALTQVNRAPGIPLLGVLVSLGMGGAGGVVLQFGGQGPDLEQMVMDAGGDPAALLKVLGALFAASLVLSTLVNLALWLARTWLLAGQLRVYRELLLETEPQASTLFSGANVYGSMLLGGALVWLISTGTYALTGAPAAPFFVWAWQSFEAGDIMTAQYWCLAGLLVLGIVTVPLATYVWAGVVFVQHAIALDGLGVLDALEKSWSLAAGNRIRLVNFGFIAFFFGGMGTIVCCIGRFYTQLVADVAWTEAYLRATGRVGENPA
jgi:hypothetical protein